MIFHRPSLSLARFTRSEFAQISGMPEEQIIAWQNDCHIEACSRDGASYKVSEVAEGMFRSDLARFGLSPDESSDLGFEGAKHILRLVLINHPESCSVWGPSDKVEQLRLVHQSSDSLIRYLFGTDDESTLLVVANGHVPAFCTADAAKLDLPHYEGAIVLNLEGYARKLVAASTRRILRFKYKCGPSVKARRASLAIS